MRVIDILNNKEITVSLEVFPPKTDAGYASVEEAARQIAALKPDFMSVTYGAGGGTSKNTANLSVDIRDKYGVEVLSHLTCVSSTREFVRERIEEYKVDGIENIMALRGDIPKEGRTAYEFDHASELIEEIKSVAGDTFCIGGACYPEGHVDCERQSTDIDNLKKKVDAGCDFLTTQMFFDNNIMYSFLNQLHAKNINVPVLAGIMPITNEKQVARSVALSGSSVPRRFRMMVDKFGDDPATMKQAGIVYATEQIIDLIANGVTHIHIYTMNKPDVAGAIMANLSEILK